MNEKNLEQIIQLDGGSTFLTHDSTSTYKVIKGPVLVYLMPIEEDGTQGRRLLIHEAMEGEIIPSFFEEGFTETWVFCLVALDHARVEEIPDTMSDELGDEFVKRAKLKNIGGEGYKDLLLEVYDRNSIKEEGYIFTSQKEREETREKSLRLILNLFDKDNLRQATPESGNQLYDAMAYVCDRKKIPIAPFDKVTASAGRRFKLEDVARVSNFIVREVVMEDGWQKKDSGPMIGYLEKGHRPIALLPKGNGYIAYDPSTHERNKVNKEYADSMEIKAYALYRPFPNKKLSIWEMFKFGFEEADLKDWALFLFLMLLGTLIGILLPMINEQIYDKYIPMGSVNGIVEICIVLLACNVGNLSFTMVKNLSAVRGVSKMKNAVLAAACERLFNLPESFYREYKSAELSDRILKIDSIFNLLSGVAVKTFVSALFSCMYLFQMNKYAPDLMMPALLMVLAVMVVIIILAVCQMKYEKELLDENAEANSRMYQFLTGIQKIRMAGVEDRVLLEYLEPYGKAKEIVMRKERMTNISGVLTASASSVFSVVLYFMMVDKLILLSVGQFSAFMAAFGAFSAAMMEVGTSLFKLNALVPMLDRVRPILEALPEYEEDSELPGDLSGEIEISNVDFAYNEESGMVLKDLSIHINTGEYIGIVGSSGCGKSTLLKLLLGFEKPVSGKIYYDSKDIDSMDKRELRKKFGVVLQDGRLISGTIFDNVTISSPGSTIKDAEEVVRKVGLEDDIKRMPMGMHTVLSETGGTISGGQAQRILIARAIIGNPKLIFFDEATSALDNVTQAMVCESLKSLNATRIVIAHRLSTIADCDRILVMDKGQVVEEGNYEALMAKKGIFYELASRQIA